MGTVIQRLRTRIDKHGAIRHTERASTFAEAEQRHGSRLDRRRNYAIIRGQVCVISTWTATCTEYSEDSYGSGYGYGCTACQQTGRARQSMWIPLSGPYAKRRSHSSRRAR